MKNLFRVILVGALFAGFAGALWGDIGFSGGSAGAAGSGDIEGILAGGGLAGGGTSGTPTLTVASTMSITGAGFDVGGSTLVVSLGKVGIGTSSPQYKLEVQGDARIYNELRVGLTTFYVKTTATPGVVGIGTTSPEYSIDASIAVALSTAGFRAQNLNSNGYQAIQLLDDSGNNVFKAIYANSTAASHPSEGRVVMPVGRLGIGTSSPLYRGHFVADAGTTGTVFAVSTGTVDLFKVAGTSAVLRVHLYFPDGTVQVTAGGAGGTPGGSDTQVQFNDGSAFGGDAGMTYNKTTDALTISTVNITHMNLGSANISGATLGTGSGSAIFSSTDTVEIGAGTSHWQFAPSSFSYTSSNGVKYLIARATHSLTVNMSSDTTNGFASRDEVFKTPPAGETWTLTKAWGHSLPSGATVQFNIGIYTSSGAYSGNSAFTLSNASATVNGTFQTSGVVASGMANPTLQAGQYWGIRCPATGHAGGPNRLIVNLEYLKQ